MANYFIGGVGRVQAFVNTEAGLQHYFDARTLTDSAISISTSAEEIRGGEGAQLLGKFFHTSVFNLNMTDALFDLKYLAAQVGAEIENGEAKHFVTKELTAAAGVVTIPDEVAEVIEASKWCADAASNKIAWVKNCDGGYDTYTVSTTNTITLADTQYAGTVCVTYPIDKAGRQIVVNAMYYPKEFIVHLTAKLFAGDACKPSTGSAIGEIVIEIPRFQLDGAVDLSLNMSSPATMALNGSAYANTCGCDDKPWYAKITEVMLDEDSKYKGYDDIAVYDATSLNPGDEIVIYAIASDHKKLPKKYDGAFTAVKKGDTESILVEGTNVIKAAFTGEATVTVTTGALTGKTQDVTVSE